MRRSVVLGLWQDRPPLEAIESAKIADELGYPELWIGEMATFDAFALATAIGLQTKQIELTIGPLAVHVRSPMTMAMGVASVAALTGRKVNLAIGTSSPVVVESWHGRRREAPAKQLVETAKELRTLLAGERGSGGYRLRLDPPGSSLTVAAFGDKAIDVAARYVDRMVINMVTPTTAARLREQLDKVAAHAGRHTPTLAVWLAAAVDPDPDAIAQITRALVAPAWLRRDVHRSRLRRPRLEGSRRNPETRRACSLADRTGRICRTHRKPRRDRRSLTRV